MTIGENIKRLRIQMGLTQLELGNLTKIPESLIKYYELSSFKPRLKHLKAIAYALGVDYRTLLDADFNKTIAMHRIFQMFRQYSGYFDNCGNLNFKELHLSTWKHQWEIYQEELTKAKTIENRKKRTYAVEDAKDKFNYWMDIYPKSECYNTNFDIFWNYYRKTKNSKRNNINLSTHNDTPNKMHFKLTHHRNEYEIQLHDEKHFLCYIKYTINNFCLHIINFTRTSGSFEYSTDIHLGTYTLNTLLLYLSQKGVIIYTITGLLSFADAYNNWKKSIPFYDDFKLHLNRELPYQLEFHLYSSSTYENEVKLPVGRSVRKKFIKKFAKEHIKSKSWASFQYDIIPIKK